MSVSGLLFYRDMKIVVACDSFKGSLTSRQANAAVAEGVLRACPKAQIDCVPVADGGEGTLDALGDALGCSTIYCKAADPAGRLIDTPMGVSADGSTAVIETAAASGLPLVEEELRHPLKLSSFGTGEQIVHALGLGCRHIIICIGGTATVDGGTGMLRALGFRFYDGQGNKLEGGAEILSHICRIEKPEGLADGVRFTAYHDVESPLCGASGAAALFGPQKGAPPAEVAELDRGLASLAAAARACGYPDKAAMPGAGAGGGIGYALATFLGAEMDSGAEAVLHASRLEERLAGASLVFTGEGRVDRTTLQGKAPFAILTAARRAGVPAVAIGGAIADEAELLQAGFCTVVAATPSSQPLEIAMRPEVAVCNISRAAERVLKKEMKLG